MRHKRIAPNRNIEENLGKPVSTLVTDSKDGRILNERII